MSTETVCKQSDLAVQHFEQKLAFEIGPVGVDRALKNNEAVQIIDLRVSEYFAKGHVPGALNISYQELEADTSKLSKEKTAIVYCYNITCHLSTEAALLLAKKGFKVKELVGGFDEYAKSGLSVEGKTHAHGSSCATAGGGCS